MKQDEDKMYEYKNTCMNIFTEKNCIKKNFNSFSNICNIYKINIFNINTFVHCYY